MTHPTQTMSIAAEAAPKPPFRLARPPADRIGWWIMTAAGLSLAVATAAGVVHPHLPRTALLAAQPFAIKLHLSTAVSALAIGLVLMSLKRGRTVHKILGWTWVVLMTTVALSSFFIRTINPGGLSWIHLISGWVTIALPLGVTFAKRKQIARHRALMTNLFVYGLLVAGLFTFLPGRLMWAMFLR